jgi:ABC-2 type transport system ATP-binding protein
VSLPSGVEQLVRHVENGIYTFALDDMAQIEFVLSALRTADIKVLDMQLNEADLEDVFFIVGRQSGTECC